MLQSLHIENIAVIKRLDTDFGNGFHALTGETGAGKSMLIDSIRLLLGDRADRELIRSGCEKACVSALFIPPRSLHAALESCGAAPDENGELYFERTLFADGRSGAKINGRTMPVSVLRQAGRLLISIHGQHDSIALLDADTHLGLLDAYAEDEALLAAYAGRYKELAKVKSELQALLKNEKEDARRAELLGWQLREIDAVKLKPGEEEALREKKKRLSQAEKIAKNRSAVYRALYQNEKARSATALIALAKEALQGLAAYLPDGEAESYGKRLDACRAELEDIALQTDALLGGDGEDPVLALAAVEDRLAEIEKLSPKYGADAEEVLALREKLAAELGEITHRDDAVSAGKKRLAALAAEAKEAAEALRIARIAAARELEQAVKRELTYLDLEKVDFKVGIGESLSASGSPKFRPDGADEVEFLISTNPGEPLRPLAKIASGGELSRIMLALKTVFADKDSIPTLIFDEIDTGVSGRTAEKIGIKLKEIGRGTQVFSVTHSAQIAACADSHYRILKEEVEGRSETSLLLLDREGRVGELSRIIGGIEITPKVVETAKEMLQIQGDR